MSIVLSGRQHLVLVVLVASRWWEKYCTSLLELSKVLCKGIGHALLVDLTSILKGSWICSLRLLAGIQMASKIAQGISLVRQEQVRGTL